MPASVKKIYPAIAMMELSNIPGGISAGDAMLKRSPIAMLKSGTVSGGKYLILIGGSVAAVDEAFNEGVRIAGDACMDCLFLPDIHTAVYAAMLGKRQAIQAESLGLFESSLISLTISAADAAVKASGVAVTEIRIGAQYAGKGFCLFNGSLEAVQIAIEIACDCAARSRVDVCSNIIPMINRQMALQLNGSSRFDQSSMLHLDDGETDVTG